MTSAFVQALYQLFNGLRLITCRFEFGFKTERAHTSIISKASWLRHNSIRKDDKHSGTIGPYFSRPFTEQAMPFGPRRPHGWRGYARNISGSLPL